MVGKPNAMVIAFGSESVDIFEVNDLMSSKGWHLNALQRPNRYWLHFQPSMNNVALYPCWCMSDLIALCSAMTTPPVGIGTVYSNSAV